jgi:uncharacterized OB-fold protein
MSTFARSLAEGKLRVMACCDCGAHQTLDPVHCSDCGSTSIDWLETAGSGRIFACTVVHRAPSKALKKVAPYTIVLVDLDEGGRLMGVSESNAAIGSRVCATTAELAGEAVVRFIVSQPDEPSPQIAG